MVQDDAHLVSECQQGNLEAFVQLYERYHPSVYRYIYYRVGNAMLAEDITSDVFVRALDGFDSYTQQGSSIAPWFFTIARNLVTDYYRRNGRITWLPLDEQLEAGEMNDPEQVADHGLTLELLRTALPCLTEEQRQVILLKFVAGRSNAEIGAILGKTEGSVKSLQHRALAALRQALEKDLIYEH